MNFSTVRKLSLIACAATLTACATVPTTSTTAPKLADLLAKADQVAASGQKEQAIKLWSAAATAHPADKAPWVSIAQTRYAAGQYGEAIVGAQEVLVRDPNDTNANSIIAISGLRLSTRALSDLSRQNNLSGSLKTESQDLAKLLRESLGEKNLFSPPPPQPPKQPVADKVKSTGKKGNDKTADKKSGDGESRADPFSTFK